MPHLVESILLEKGSDIITVRTDATIRQAAKIMIDTNVGCLIAEDDRGVVGILTERDVLRRVIGCDKDPNSTPVSEIMSSPINSCTPSDDIEEIFKILSASNNRHLLVVDHDKPVGVISLRDISFILHHADRERQRLAVSGVEYL
ncbi:MAG: CBS domain-containing protein [Phycisphaerales bacterium]|nr:CBS domain-containing protein [Phycisphaerales bacterium]